MVTGTSNRIANATGRAEKPNLQTVSPETASGKLAEIPLNLIDPHPDNPRGDWENQEITRMVPSAKQAGIVQAIVVRPMGDRFQLVAGERRYRAAQAARLKTIPAVVKQLTPEQVLEQMLIENLQRKNLNAIEKAHGVERLCKPAAAGGAGKTLTAAAALFGKSPSWASNLIRLLQLPKKWQRLVASGQVSERAARQLLTHLESPDLLKAVENDMKANPWAWQTTADFERSLAIIVANPKAAGKPSSDPGKPRAPRAKSSPPASEFSQAVAAAQGSSVTEEREASPLDIERICDSIGRLKSLEELDIVQLAIDCQKESLKAKK